MFFESVNFHHDTYLAHTSLQNFQSRCFFKLLFVYVCKEN